MKCHITWSLIYLQTSLVVPVLLGLGLTQGAVMTEQLNLMKEVSKMAGISYCNKVKLPFECNVWCSDFENATLIQVYPFQSRLATIYDV